VGDSMFGRNGLVGFTNHVNMSYVTDSGDLMVVPLSKTAVYADDLVGIDFTPIAANNSKVSVGYTVNLIGSFFYGLGPAVTYTTIPSLHLKCLGGGIGASAGHNFSFGPTVVSTQNAKDILSSWSVSGGYNFTPLMGGGGSANSSGAASGNTFGVPGAGGAVTWSKCWGGS
jgi:hypothetical protein